MLTNPYASGLGEAARRSVVRAAVGALTGGAAVAGLAAAGVAQAAPDSVWDRVARCESSGDWHINTGNGFHGGLQFTAATWRGFGGGQFAASAENATREQQITVAERVLKGQGWHAWPVCGRRAGLDQQGVDLRTSPADVPARPSPAVSGGTYRVRPGDTLSAIARRHSDGDWRRIAARNGIDPDRILPGRLLRL